jgi:hypothetical protein
LTAAKSTFEVDRSRPALELPRVEERRKRLGDVVEDALPLLLLRLDPLPVRSHPPGCVRVHVAEYVRVAPDELLVDPAGDRLE